MALPMPAAAQPDPGQTLTLLDDSPEKSGFQKIFNGTNLAGWEGHPTLWSVRDGAITGETTPENPATNNTFLIWTNGVVGDFELRCAFRISPHNQQGFANSGIQYRSRVFNPSYWVVGGYQADMEAGPNYTGNLYEELSPRQTMATRGEIVVWDKDCRKQVVGSLGTAAELQSLIRQGDWNEYRVIAAGNHLRHFINGRPMVEITDDCEARRAMKGILALQLHAGPAMTVQYKDLWLKDLSATAGASAEKKIVFIAGAPSHGPGEHEHRAGCLLLKACLDRVPGVTSVVYSNGWPENAPAAFENAASVVVYSDGAAGHPLLQDERLEEMDALMKKGVGLVCIHFAVEPTREKGETEFLDWLGGCFEINKSVNPEWRANFAHLPDSPITRGVSPFEIQDEWYFNMRFREGMNGVTPILVAVPTPDTTSRPDGPHEGNPEVREAVKRGDPQTMAWAFERANGGRAFGFTGAHHHANWGNDNFRKIVLNAILWTAKLDVPANGVESTVSPGELKQNLDPKRRR